MKNFLIRLAAATFWGFPMFFFWGTVVFSLNRGEMSLEPAVVVASIGFALLTTFVFGDKLLEIWVRRTSIWVEFAPGAEERLATPPAYGKNFRTSVKDFLFRLVIAIVAFSPVFLVWIAIVPSLNRGEIALRPVDVGVSLVGALFLVFALGKKPLKFW